MKYSEIRDLLSDESQELNMFELLRRITSIVNDKSTEAIGRDLVIRALPHIKKCSDFEKSVLTGLVRNVGLFPYMKESLDHATLDDFLAYELHRPDGLQEVFHSLQARIYYQLRAGSNVVLSASTSVGKSLLIDAMIALGKFKKIVVIVPTLALIDETRRRLTKRFQESIHVITHQSQVADPDKPNVYVLTQERVLPRIDLSNVDFFVVDEFYKLDIHRSGDKERAVNLNLAFHKLASTGAQFYLLGPNVHAIRGLTKYEFHFIPSEFTTVAVDVVQFNLPMRGTDRLDTLVELCRKLSGPTLIYSQSPPGAARLAEAMLKRIDPPPSPAALDTAQWLDSNFHASWIVSRAVRRGIGLHHGGIPRSIQQHMVRLFEERIIRFLICTSTLIEGVNTAAENVIIYDRRRNTNLLDFFTYKNIQGRAGRMGRYFVGKVFVLETPPEEKDVVVEYSADDQAPQTPLSLLMQLDDADLTAESRERLAEEFSKRRILSEATIKANCRVAVEVQEQIAAEILSHPNRDTIFSWQGFPTFPQLEAVCEPIVKHLSRARLGDLGISNGSSLAWHLNAFGLSKVIIQGYLDQIVRRLLPGQNASDAIDNGLKIIRNVFGFTFPQDLIVIHNIQRDILSTLEIRPGDYTVYAEAAENLFLPGALSALDEYGLPLQVAVKLRNPLAPHYELDSILGRLRTLDPDHPDLLPFERALLAKVQEGL